MAYKKTNWQDRQVEKPMTFNMVKNDNGTITLTPYPGVVENEGTKVTAARMNNIENGIVSGSVPTGCILPFCGVNAPQGYLLCNGAAISRETYADLYSVIGTTYGQGDNSTTFNVPDMQGRIPAGIKSGSVFGALGKTLGEEEHTLTIPEMPKHRHDMYYRDDGGRIQHDVFVYDGFLNNRSIGDAMGDSGEGKPHNNIQPTLVVNYIIKT